MYSISLKHSRTSTKKEFSHLSVTHIVFVAFLRRNCRTRLLTSSASINTIRCVTSVHSYLLAYCSKRWTLTWIWRIIHRLYLDGKLLSTKDLLRLLIFVNCVWKKRSLLQLWANCDGKCNGKAYRIRVSSPHCLFQCWKVVKCKNCYVNIAQGRCGASTVIKLDFGSGRLGVIFHEYGLYSFSTHVCMCSGCHGSRPSRHSSSASSWLW